MSDDSGRNIPGQTPSNGERHPSRSDKNDTDTEPDKIPIYNQRSATNNQNENGTQQDNRGHRFEKFFKRIPNASAWVAIFTGILIVETFCSIRTSQEANELNAGVNRPWVRADVSVLGLNFQKQPDGKYEVAVTSSVTVKNTGQFPANSVIANPVMIPISNQSYNPIEIIKSRCVHRKAANGWTLGDALLKDNSLADNITATLNNLEYQNPLAAWLLICVTYEIPFNGKTGRSGYLFVLGRRQADKPGAIFVIVPKDGPVTPPALVATREGSYVE